MLAPALMVQGTASNVGKSLLVTALCRLFHQDGLRVLPFKSQNMALNSFVVADGGEIGRAQAVQAEAAGVPASVDMNPILIKPEGESRSQIVVRGEVLGTMSGAEFQGHKPALRQVIAGCLERLRRRCDLVIIEGAGSPVEINLKATEIVNMHVARAASAPVLLVGDIDRGGLFAALVGTMELLEPDERALVAGFVVNKFRGDLGLLRPGLDELTRRTGRPVVGVLPYLPRLRIADEDSLALDSRRGRARRPGPDEVDVAVVRLPRIANHDDFAPLEHEPGVAVRFVDEARDLAGADLVVLPGSKSTVADLGWLRERGLAAAVLARAAAGEPLLGICGGFQMMGRRLEDPDHLESERPATEGLGLLPVCTRFAAPKITAQVRARPRRATFLTEGVAEIRGYEIHMGRVEAAEDPLFEIRERNGQACALADGAVQGQVVGTLIHGLFASREIRGSLINFLRRRRGLPAAPLAPDAGDAEYDRLAAAAREHLDLALVRRLIGR